MILRGLLFAAALACAASAQTFGVFTAAGPMNVPRADHTATLLANGKVLIAGGYFSPPFGNPANTSTATAELYDPATGVFSPTGNMTRPRERHAATLLADGRVLIAGGTMTDFSVELYDPSTGQFTAAPDPMPRGSGLAVLLRDGRVLLAGYTEAELFDPITGTFSPAGAYPAGSSALDTATLLPDGRVLLTGCTGGDYQCDAGVTEIYDPSAGRFRTTGDASPMQDWGDVNTATVLPNGKVLFVGNYENDGFPADSELYDPLAEAFTRLGNAIGPHEFSTAVLLSDGAVLVAGGQLPGGDGDNTAELYDPSNGTFSAAGYMLAPRHSHTATLLPDGSVLIAGGWSSWPVPTTSAEIYRPEHVQTPPVLLSISGDGHGQGAIQHADTYQVVAPDNPATAGEALIIYCTGLPEASVIPPQVAIGGRMAEVLWFGKTPGYTGLNQVNVRMPSGVAPNPAVSVRLTYLGRASNEVTIAVR